jgi:hypothetical protein
VNIKRGGGWAKARFEIDVSWAELARSWAVLRVSDLSSTISDLRTRHGWEMRGRELGGNKVGGGWEPGSDESDCRYEIDDLRSQKSHWSGAWMETRQEWGGSRAVMISI